jgi:hypothetical protein
MIALRCAPDYPLALLALASLETVRREHGAAHRLLNEVLSLLDTRHRFYRALTYCAQAELEHVTGRYEKARARFKDAMGICGDIWSARFCRVQYAVNEKLSHPSRRRRALLFNDRRPHCDRHTYGY